MFLDIKNLNAFGIIKLFKNYFQNSEFYKKGFEWVMLKYFEEGKTINELKSFDPNNKDLVLVSQKL